VIDEPEDKPQRQYFKKKAPGKYDDPRDYNIVEYYAYRLETISTGVAIGPIFAKLGPLQKYFYNKYYKRFRAKVLTPTFRETARTAMQNLRIRKYRYRLAPIAEPLDISILLYEGDDFEPREELYR
jgi:hypothetical protein